MLVAFLAGAGMEVFSIGWSVAMQEHIDERVLSRAYSYDALGSFVAMPLGQILYGPLGDTFGYRPVLLVSGVVYLATVLLVAVVAVRARPASGGAEGARRARASHAPHFSASARITLALRLVAMPRAFSTARWKTWPRGRASRRAGARPGPCTTTVSSGSSVALDLRCVPAAVGLSLSRLT